MKRLLITSILAIGVCAPALAETSIEVVVPANIEDTATAEAYKTELTDAIRKVCRRASGPAFGVAYYTLKDCIEATSLDVAAKDPTGLLALEISAPKPLQVAGN